MDTRDVRATVAAAAAVVGVGTLVVGGTAWSLGASTGVVARPVSTTDVRPTSTRSKTISFDASAQMHALVDLPDPLPELSDDSRCIDLTAHDGTWPVFNGSTITVPGYNAQLCPEPSLGSWTVGWYGTRPGASGSAAPSSQAAFTIDVVGTDPIRMAASMRSGPHRYQYMPDWQVDEGRSDQYVLTDSYYGDGVSTTLHATGNPESSPTQPATTAPATGAGAAPAVPVSGRAGYAG